MNSAMFDPLVHIPYAEGFDKCVQQALALNRDNPVINLYLQIFRVIENSNNKETIPKTICEIFG